MILNDTKIEKHGEIYVKREDLSCPSGGPPFSKVRGLIPYLMRIKDQGIQTVGYTETSVSMAGWGVSWACSLLGMKSVIFDPQYKVTPPLLRYHRNQWKRFCPDIIPIPAGRAKVNFYMSRKLLLSRYPSSEMLPLGLILPETIEAVYSECKMPETADLMDRIATIVVCIGSGTIGAGLLRAFPKKSVIGVMSRTGSIARKRSDILKKANLSDGGFFGVKDFLLIDPGWEYAERSRIQSPFPSHPWYDLKAWQWLMENLDLIKKPILFWNIGRVK